LLKFSYQQQEGFVAKQANVVNLKQQETPYEGSVVSKARLRITVEGIEPLMTHNPAGMQQSNESKRGSRIPKPEDEAEAGCYRLEDGTCAIKAESFIGSMVGKGGAASAWKAGKRTTMKGILAHITATEELLPLSYPDGTPISDYTIDIRSAVVMKARILRARPRYDKWRTSFTIEYDPVLVPEDARKQIVDICADAGVRVGVGDYRPRFGRFRVVSYSFLD
jgi:hypothetical protein